MKKINRLGPILSNLRPTVRRKNTTGSGRPLAGAGHYPIRPAQWPFHRNVTSQSTPCGVKEISEAKNRFLEAAAHDFSEPLNAIVLSADLIENYYDSLTRQNLLNEITAIKTAATYLSAIVKDFLSNEDIDKRGLQPVMTVFDLQNLTETIIGQMKHQTKDWQDIKYVHTGATAQISLDKKLLEHCLVNLISNAIKFSDVADHIEVVSEINGDLCKISIKDYGIGIPDKEMDGLFKPFFRASNASHTEGTGLGLSLVKRYTGLMGGQVTVQKNGGKGTVFNLVFPVTPWHGKHRDNIMK